jgi:hypothetical protein
MLVAGTVTGCTSHGAPLSVQRAPDEGPPVSVHDAKDARAAVRASRVVRTLVFDGGILRITPATERHPRGEAHAIALARSSSPAGTTTDVSEVVVGYGLASLTMSVTTQEQVVRPVHTPVFHDRPVWFLVHENGPHSCPAMPAPSSVGNGTRGREPLPLELIAADGSGEGIAYRGSGSFCGFPTQSPVAQPALYSLSLPWHVASSTSTSLTLAAKPPRCGTISTVTGPGWPDTTIGVSAEVVMAQGSCRGDESRPVVVQRPRDGSVPKHAATGLVRGMMTESTGFTFFDGASHTIR